jgi:uncharacterized protein (DUF58 family)
MNLAWRVLYRIYRMITGLQHSLMRRFTKPGLTVLGGFVVAGMIGGLDTENSVGDQAVTLLLFLLVTAFASSLYFRGSFTATRMLPRFGTAGQPFTYRVTVKNHAAHTQKALTLLENLADPRPSFEEWRDVQLANEKLRRPFRLSPSRRTTSFQRAKVNEARMTEARPGGEAETAIEVTPLQRGVLRFDGVTLARPDPLGLFRAFLKYPLPQSVLILPKRYPLPAISLPGTLRYQEGGVALASNIGRSDEFVSLREYRRGDPLRHIHWRSWAKTGKPIVKEFEDEFFARYALVLDTFTDVPRSEEFEEAVAVAASFACTIPSQESLLDLLFVGAEAYCFTAGRGLAHADQLLEVLASARTCTGKPFNALETLVVNHSHAVSGCICVFLSWDERRQEFVKRLRMLGLPLLVLVVMPEGHREKLDPGPMKDEPHHFHVLEAGRIEEGLARL